MIEQTTGTSDTLVYAFTGLPTSALGAGRLTIATTGTGADGIDLDGEGEYFDVDFDGMDGGRFECENADDGGTLIPGNVGGIDCLFDFDLALSEPVLAGAIADGIVTVNLVMGPNVGFFLENDEIAVTLSYEEGTAVVPLPASLPFLLAGLGGLALLRRRG